MSAPVWRTELGSIALTVAAVPTGIKAGVRISPRGVWMVPARALPERACNWNENFSVMGLTCAKPYEGSSDWSKNSWVSQQTNSAPSLIQVIALPQRPAPLYLIKTLKDHDMSDETPVEGTPLIATSSTDHPLYDNIVDSIRTVYDPEIPVNILDLGLIYTVDIN